MRWILKLTTISVLLCLSYIVAVDSAVNWSTPINVSNNSGDSGGLGHYMVIDNSGKLHAVWNDNTPGNIEIFYSRNDGSGWSPPVNISNTATASAGGGLGPIIGIDGTGKLHVIWLENVASFTGDIFYTSNSGAGWSTPVSILQMNDMGGGLSMSVESSGKVHVAWLHFTAQINGQNYFKLYYAWKDGAKLTNPVEIDDNTLPHAYYPFILSDSSSRLHLFRQNKPTGTPGSDIEIYYNRNDGTGWGNRINISNSPGLESSAPFAVMDKSGILHVSWTEGSSGYYTRYDGNSWATPVRVMSAVEPFMSVDSFGKPHMLVYAASVTSSSGIDVFYSRDYGNGWSTPENISKGGGYGSGPILFDSSGNLHVIWRQKVSSTNWEIFYSKGTLVPTVNSTSPASLVQGTTNQNVIISGSDFKSGATVSFSGTGITVNSVTVNSPIQITANISISSNAAAESRNVTVTNPDGSGTATGAFTVTPTPIAQVSTTTVNAGIVNKGFSGTATFTVTNAGGGTLSVSNITSSNPQFTVSPTSFSLTAGASRTVTVTFSPTVVGWEQGILTITHNASGSPATVTANGIGRVEPPKGDLKNTKIAFYSYPEFTVGKQEIYVINADGTDLKRLTDHNLGNALQPSWLPDGKEIAFISQRDGKDDEIREIYVMNADGTTQKRRTYNQMYVRTFSWSPDGTKIVFSAPPGTGDDGDILKMNAADGSNIINLTNNPAYDQTPSWSPDGKKIAFASTRDGGGWHIYVMNADKTNLKRLTNTNVVDSQPSWSPDGTKIAFMSERDGNPEIYVMNADGTNQIRLTTHQDNDVNPSWSPDGTMIVFTSGRNATTEIYVMNAADGASRTQLTTNTLVDVVPSWSPFLIPEPEPKSVNPSTMAQGATNPNIIISGTNFQPGATVAFSGTGITINSVTFNSPTQLTANISVASTAAAGLRDITVTNPDTGSGTKTGAFTVIIPPTITSLNPASRGQGATNQNITITGTNFQSGATVSFGGEGITVNTPVTFNSATQLTVNISVAPTAAPGSRDVTVTNPDGGKVTKTGAFTVIASPTITSLNPSSRGQGATNQNIVIIGTGFQQNATVSFSGTGITVNSTTFNSSTQLTVNISIASNATADSRNITVTNPDGGVGVLNNALTITPAPIPTVLNPTSRGQGATNQNIVITGTGFQNNATVLFSGTGITVNSTTFNSSTQLTVNLSIAANATADSRNITITNPDGGIGTLNGAFTINPAPTIISLNPFSLAQGSTNQNITILGANFQSGATVTFSGDGITTVNPPVTFNSATQLTVNISIASNATPGSRDVAVTNPDGGKTTKTGAYTVTSPPIIDSLNPASLPQGSTNQSIIISGNNFQSGATVAFSGTGITVNLTTFNSATQLTVNIGIDSSATVGLRDITVANSDGGKTTKTGVFTIISAPTIATLNPDKLAQGSANKDIIILGTNFQSVPKVPTVTFSGTGITVNLVTFIRETQLTVNVSIATTATIGSRDVTVTNPDGGKATKTGAFTVTEIFIFTPTAIPIRLISGSATIPTGVSVGTANGGVKPYVFAEGTPDLAWLNINQDGTIALAAGQVVSAVGTYTLNVKVTDSTSPTPNMTTGTVTIFVPPRIKKFRLNVIKSISITVSWKSWDEVSDYEIFYSTDQNSLSNLVSNPNLLSMDPTQLSKDFNVAKLSFSLSPPRKLDRKEIGNLTANTTYYFMIRLASGTSNWSDLSQTISAKTHPFDPSDKDPVTEEEEIDEDVIKIDKFKFEDSGVSIENLKDLAQQNVSVTKHGKEPRHLPDKSKKPDKPESGKKMIKKHWEIKDIPGKFSNKVKLTFHYADSEIQSAGLNEDKMVIAYHDKSENDWKEVTTERDKNHKVLWTLTDHFSIWTITEPSPPVITLIEPLDTVLKATSGTAKLIKVKVEAQAAIQAARVFYLTGGQAAYFSLDMFDDGLHNDGAAKDGIWARELPALKVNLNGLAFYVTATDVNNQSTDTINLNLPDGSQISPTKPASVEVTGDIIGPEANDGKTYGDIVAYDDFYAQGQIPGWKSSADWTMLSFPLILPDPDPEKVLAQWGKPEVDWEAYQFNGGADYDRAIRIPRSKDPRGDIEKFISIQSGKAAWIWPGDNPRAIIVKSAKSQDLTKLYAIKLNSGWNQIGNPFRFARFWNKNVKFGTSNDFTKAIDINTAAKNGQIANPAIIYLRAGFGYFKIASPDDNGIVPAGTFSGGLEPWQGYWFLSRSDGWLFIDPDPKAGPTPSPPAIAPAYAYAYAYESQSPTSLTPLTSLKGWMMELNANGIKINAGMEENALNAQDSLDFPTPPVAAKDSLRFTFAHPEWNDRFSTHYDQDIRRLSRDGATWEIEVMSDGKPVEITWKQLYEVPREYMLMLVDPTTGASVDLKKETSYTLASEGSRKLYFVASISGRGIPEFLAKLIVKKTEVLQNFPNPFNPETWIPYQLSEASEVEIRIYDISGRLVRRLSLGRSEAGIYINKGRAAYWDGRNEAGERVASGVYFYQLRAGEFVAMKKMLIAK